VLNNQAEFDSGAGKGGWPTSEFIALVLVTAIAAISFIPGLNLTGFWSPSEGRVVEISREMIATSDYILPRINGVYAITKPPLIHWITCFMFSNFGYTEFAARIPCAIFGLLTVIGVFLIGRKFFGITAAVVAALALALTPDFVFISRGVRIDGPLTALTTWAGFCLICALTERRKRKYIWSALGGITAGLAVVAKGPVGLLIPVLIIIGLMLCRGHEKKGSVKLIIIAGACCALVSLPWYLAVMWYAPANEKAWFFSGQLKNWAEGKEKGVFYKLARFPMYIPYLLKGFFPWSFILPAGLIAAFRRGRKKTSDDTMRKLGLWVVLSWFLGGLFLFSLCNTKAARYILPLYPAMALLVGFAFQSLTDDKRTRLWACMGIGAAALVMAAGLIVTSACAFGFRMDSYGANSLPATNIDALVLAVKPYFVYIAIACAVGVGAAVAAFKFARSEKPVKAACAFAVCGALIVWGYSFFAAPRLDKYNSCKAFAKQCRSHVGSDTELYLCGDSLKPLYFYLGRKLNYVSGINDTGALQKLSNSLKSTRGTYAIIVSKKGKPIPDKHLKEFNVILRGVSRLRSLYLVTVKEARAKTPSGPSG